MTLEQWWDNRRATKVIVVMQTDIFLSTYYSEWFGIALFVFSFLMAYQPSWLMSCQSYHCRRKVQVLYNPQLERGWAVRVFTSFRRVIDRNYPNGSILRQDIAVFHIFVMKSFLSILLQNEPIRIRGAEFNDISFS